MKKVNKSTFISILQDKTKLSSDECLIINDILESNFVFGKRNKQKIIGDLIDKLNIGDEKAEEIYNISMTVIASTIKERIKHPFKSLDN